MNVPFTPGQLVNNREIMNVFKCACEGGIRKSNTTNTVVLINRSTSQDPGIPAGTIAYEGSGKGNQTLEKGKNKTLLKAFDMKLPVFLFEKEKPGVYKFLGRVSLVNPPFQEERPDQEGHNRKVWIFPLKITS